MHHVMNRPAPHAPYEYKPCSGEERRYEKPERGIAPERHGEKEHIKRDAPCGNAHFFRNQHAECKERDVDEAEKNCGDEEEIIIGKREAEEEIAECGNNKSPRGGNH